MAVTFITRHHEKQGGGQTWMLLIRNKLTGSLAIQPGSERADLFRPGAPIRASGPNWYCLVLARELPEQILADRRGGVTGGCAYAAGLGPGARTFTGAEGSPLKSSGQRESVAPTLRQGLRSSKSRRHGTRLEPPGMDR